ncbi:MAG: polysaccharide biosynthesis C-terminal domain-containing protein [Chitinophagaceae bacterium]
MGKASLCFIMNTISLVANLAINYICLINFGFYGAAIGTLISLTLISIAWYFIMKKQIGLEILNIFKYMIDFYKKAFTTLLTFASKKKKMVQ